MSGLVRKHHLHKLTKPYIVRLVCPCPKYSVLQNSVATFSVDIVVMMRITLVPIAASPPPPLLTLSPG